MDKIALAELDRILATAPSPSNDIWIACRKPYVSVPGRGVVPHRPAAFVRVRKSLVKLVKELEG